MTIVEAQDVKLLGDIYEGSQNPALWQAALTQIRDRLNSNMVMLLEVNEQSSHSALMSLMSWTEIDPAMLCDYAAHWGQHDPFPDAMIRRSALGRMNASQDIIDPSPMRGMGFYNEFWRRYDDIFWSIGGLFQLGPNQIGCFAAPRERYKGAYTPEQARWLESVVPHFQRAFRMRSVFSNLSEGAASLLEILNDKQVGIATLDAEGGVLAANDALLQLLRGHLSITICRNLLEFTQAADRYRFQSLLAWLRQVRAGTSLASPPACQIGTNGQLGVRAIPLRVETAICQGLAPNCVAILVFSQKARPALRDELAHCFKCTPAEIEVALDLAAGLAPSAISVKRCVALATVRSQVKRIYIKLGVNRQSELIRKLSAGAGL